MPTGKPIRTSAGFEARKRRFMDEYIALNRNGTQAAIAAGFSPNCAARIATRILRDPEIKAQIAHLDEKLSKISGLNAERTIREIARRAYFDPKNLFAEDGTLKRVVDLDDDTRAAINIEQEYKDGELVLKIKTCDKDAALQAAAKHLGLFEKDNAQRAPSLAIQIVTVGPD